MAIGAAMDVTRMREGKGGEVAVDLESMRFVCFALEQRGFPFIHFTAENLTTEMFEGATLDIELAPGLGDRQSFALPTLPPGEKGGLPIDYRLTPGRLRQVIEAERGQLTWSVRCQGRVLANAALPIDILPFNHWPGAQVAPALLAMFVTPNHVQIAQVLQSARDRLRKQTGDAAFEGYQSRSTERVRAMVRALYESIQSLDLTYAEAPPSFEKVGQKIRLPEILLRDQIGCCLDVATIFCACLEHMGLNSLLFVIEGHAFHGAWLVDECFPELVVEDPARIRNLIKLGQLLAIDSSTNVKTPAQSFEAAIAAANGFLDDDDAFEHAIDVKTARHANYRPLPLRDEVAGVTSAAAIPELPAASAAPAPRSTTPVATRARPEPPPAAAAGRFRKWQERLLDLTLRNRLLNLGKAGRGWLPIEVPDLGVFEDILSTGQAVEVRPRPAPEAEAIFAERRADPAAVQKDLAELRSGTVYVPAPPAALNAIAKRLERARRTDLEEGGANSLYAGIGVLKWCEPGSKDFHLAPLLLYPIELSVDRARGRLQICRLPEEPIGNPTLCEKLRREYQVELTPLVDLDTDDQGIDVPRLIRGVRAAIQSKAGWEVLDVACIGQFTFTKFLMWKDLDENAKVLCENPVVRHIAERDSRFAASGREVSPDELDVAFPPADLPCVLNADSTQMAAIASALSGRSFVLQGPPGTGKSQTITNLIAAAIAQGKTVLFVSEKMAALDVVYRRLKEAGLEDFCLEIHSNKSNKREVLDSLARAFRRDLQAESVPWTQRSTELAEARRALNAHAIAVNGKRASGDSFYALSSKLLSLASEPDLGFPIPGVEEWSNERLRQTRDIVADFASHAARVEPPSQHPWRVARQSDWSSEQEETLREVLDQTRQQLDEVETSAGSLANLLGIVAPRSTADLHDLATVASIRDDGPIAAAAFSPGFPAVAARCSAYAVARRAHEARETALQVRWRPEFLTSDLTGLEHRFGRWASAFFLFAWLLLLSARRGLRPLVRSTLPSNRQISADLAIARSAREEAEGIRTAQARLENDLTGLWTTSSASLEALEDLVARASRAHEAARRLATANPAVASNLSAGGRPPEGIGSRSRALQEGIERLYASESNIRRCLAVAPSEGWPPPADPTHREALREVVERWQLALGSFRNWCHYRRGQTQVDAAEIGGLAQAHLAGKVTAARLTPAFERTLHARLVGRLRDRDSVLRSFSGTSYHRLVERFGELDRDHVELSRGYVAGRLEERLPRLSSAIAESSEPGILAREIEKKKKHLPIRKLLIAIPNLLPKLKPCVLMSPLSVAQYLPADGRRFDLVVFDEASQIGTHDAIGAIARGSQVIVVGDSKQLPPTSFFSRTADDNDAAPDDNDQEELESILDEAVAKGLPQQMLGWHYRSRHHSLIEFSNRSYYDGRLHVFPAAGRELPDLGVIWHPVADGVYFGSGSDTNPRTNPREAAVLVDHLVTSLRRYEPGTRTFGVVTFSMAQKALIEALLEDARLQHPEIEAHFDRDEEVFVKNLENVQGDERDEILFSICYAKDARGKLRLHFGPLSNKGGERRLNVAITRARVQLRVFSTLTHDQIDLKRTDSRGAADLKEFLAYAARRGVPDERALTARNTHFPSHFERDIRDVAVALGFEVHSLVGAGGYRVDIAVVHPREQGKYVLGIECDGPNYASAKTARDRNRLRGQVLGDLGWKLHRVWSSDWALDREGEVKRLKQALDDALAAKAAAQSTAPPPIPAVSRPESSWIKSAPVVSPATKAASAPLQGLAPRSQPAAAPSAQSRPYSAAELPIVSTETDSLYWESSEPQIQHAVALVVAQEGPVHVDVVGRRVIGSFGLTKLTAKAATRVADAIAHLERRRLVAKRNDFLWPSQYDRYEEFRGPTQDGTPRDVQFVAPEEIANAAAWVLQQNLSLERTDLGKETAALFGVSRMGKNVVNAIDGGIAQLLARGLCTEEGSRVSWVGSTSTAESSRPHRDVAAPRSPTGEVPADVLALVASGDPIAYVVDQPELRSRNWTRLRTLLDAIEEHRMLFKLAGRLVISFHGFDRDPRAIPEIPECRDWLLGIEKEVPHLFFLLDPGATFQILMLCHLPFSRQEGRVALDQDKAMGFVLDCAYVSYQLGRIHGQDARRVAVDFLNRVGLEGVVNDELLGDFARTFEQENP